MLVSGPGNSQGQAPLQMPRKRQEGGKVHAGAAYMREADGLRSAAYWHERAEEVRARASEVLDVGAATAMQGIALMYDRLAERAEDRDVRQRRSK